MGSGAGIPVGKMNFCGLRKGFFTSTISHARQPPSPPANAKAQRTFISLLGTEHGCLLRKGAGPLSSANVIDETSLQAPALCG